ncbi:MAG TPA: transposase [Bacteroidales bacterium]|nr:transposase [Bacteroidales bacterium]
MPKRWIVERTFVWLGFQRRLVRDYEVLPECSRGFVHIAMIRLMLNKINF